MLDWLTDMDTALFLALNGALPWLDGLMWWVSVPCFGRLCTSSCFGRLAQRHPNWQPRVAMLGVHRLVRHRHGRGVCQSAQALGGPLAPFP